MRVTEPYTIFLRTLPSGKKIYYYQFRYENGTRSPAYSCGTNKLSQAKRVCQRLYNQGQFKNNNEITFAVFSKGFFDDDSEFCEWRKLNDKQLSKSSLVAYRQALNLRLLPYFGKMKIKNITVGVVKDWILWTKDKYSPKTSNNAQSVLGFILKSAKEKNIIDSVPTESMSYRKVIRRKRQLLTVDELSKIYHSKLWNSETLQRSFLLSAITGMRIGEITGLQTYEVESDRLNVEHSLDPRFGLGETKTKNCRYVPIPKSLDLKKYCGKQFVFENKDGSPITRNVFYKKFITVCNELGIKTKERGITVHTLRNTFISYMRGSVYGERIDLKIKAVVGHSDKSMTDWYTYWTPEMFPEIYEIQEELYKKIIKN